MNRTDIIGNVGDGIRFEEITVKSTGELKKVLNFSVAVNEKYRNGDTEIKKVMWYSCSLWGKFAESMQAYLTKGKQVFISGKLEPTLYQKDNGDYGIDNRLHVNHLQLLGKLI